MHAPLQAPTSLRVAECELTIWTHENTREEAGLLIPEVPDRLPLPQRPEWPPVVSGERYHLVRFQSSRSADVAWVGIRDYPMRSLPGARVWRVLKYGGGVCERMHPHVLSAIRMLSERWPRIVRVHVEVNSIERPELLERIVQSGRDEGFSAHPPREYRRTRLVPLDPTAPEGTRGLHRSVLKNVRKTERLGHVVLPVTERAYVPRMLALLRETMARTGAAMPEIDIEAVVRSCQRYPDRFRVSALFRSGVVSSETLMAFRWCGSSGPIASDLLAASTRLVEGDGHTPMMHAILLDIFRWASSRGTTTFDFGGVLPPDDPRYETVGSISHFKQLFGGFEADVGADLLFTSRPLLSRLSGSLSRMVGSLRT